MRRATHIKIVDDQSPDKRSSIPTPSSGPMVSQRYRILTKIGTGGMGDVFLGIQHGAVDFQRLIVIKQIHSYLFAQQNQQQMFVDEASLVASLDHPNIVKIIDFRQSESAFHIVMEYVDGETLKVIHKLSQKKGIPIPFPLACKLITQPVRRFCMRTTPHLGMVHLSTLSIGTSVYTTS